MKSKNLVSASEIAQMGLPSLPTSRDNIRARADREGWYFEERRGQGGIKRVYAIPEQYLPQPQRGEVHRGTAAETATPPNWAENMVLFTMAGSESPAPVHMAFSRHWIQQQLQVKADDLQLMQVPGDSMAGTLNSRDVVLVNKADTQPANGLFVLRLDGVLEVKRLQRLPGAKLKVSGSNEAYDPFEIDLTQATPGFVIVGKLVWHGRVL